MPSYLNAEFAPGSQPSEANPKSARRAAVVAELHDRLIISMWETENLLSSVQQYEMPEQQQTKHEKAVSRMVELLYHFHGQYRFYISRQMRILLDDLITEMHSHVNAFLDTALAPNSGAIGEMNHVKLKSWIRGWKTIKYQISVASQALENEFRSLTQPEAVHVIDDAVIHQTELFAFPASRAWASRNHTPGAPFTGSLAA